MANIKPIVLAQFEVARALSSYISQFECRVDKTQPGETYAGADWGDPEALLFRWMYLPGEELIFMCTASPTGSTEEVPTVTQLAEKLDEAYKLANLMSGSLLPAYNILLGDGYFLARCDNLGYIPLRDVANSWNLAVVPYEQNIVVRFPVHNPEDEGSDHRYLHLFLENPDHSKLGDTEWLSEAFRAAIPTIGTSQLEKHLL